MFSKVLKNGVVFRVNISLGSDKDTQCKSYVNSIEIVEKLPSTLKKQRFDLDYSEMLIAAFLEAAKAHVKQHIDMIKISVTKVNNTDTQKAHLSYQFERSTGYVD